MSIVNSTTRFSNRVAHYVKYRPGYPAEIMPFLHEHCGLNAEKTVADIGCGTGISSRLFLEYGCTVIGVEPNAAMRAAAVEYLADFPLFDAVDGTAETTTLGSASVDLVTAAQAFHWFDGERTAAEFRRILRPGGWMALIWNERQLDTTPFLRDYEAFLLRFATDYNAIRHDRIDETVLRATFATEMRTATFPNHQELDLDGLRGRTMSSSYMPVEGTARYPEMIGELTSLFAKHAENGRIKIFYDTRIFCIPA